MNINRNMRLIDAYTIGTSLIFILPVIIPYYRDQIGLGFREFLLGEAAFAATLVLLEVPTGWLSDIWQRKHVMVLGILFDIIGFSCLLIANSFLMAVLAQILIGIGISLCSGTNTAILYDTLLSVGRETEYRKREGRRQAFRFYAIAISSVIGGLVYPIDPQLPIIMTLFTLTGALVAAYLLDEPERHKRISVKHPIADIIATIRYALHGHAEIAFIILFAGALFCSTKMIMWSQQPYYMALKIPEVWYGALMAIGFMLGGTSSHWAHLLDGRISAYRALAIVWFLAVIVCIGAAISPGWHGVILLMVGGTCIYGAASPRVNEVINKHVDSSRRATVLSTQSLMVSALFIPISAIMGYVSKHWGIQAVLFSLALWLCVAGLFLALFVRYRKSKQFQKAL